MFSAKTLEEKYTILRKSLSVCSTMEEIEPFLFNLSTLDDLKDYLLQILDDKFEMKENSKLDSIYLNCASIHDILPDEIHGKITSFISPREYAKLPCISKHFEYIMSNYPSIYNDWNYQVVISKTLTSTILKGQNGVYLSHSLTELKIQPSFANHFSFEDIQDIGLGFAKAKFINPFKLKFPWKFIKIWHINNCDLRRSMATLKIRPPKSIIHILRKHQKRKKKNGKKSHLQLMKEEYGDDYKNEGVKEGDITSTNQRDMTAISLRVKIASRTIPTIKLLEKAATHIESLNIDCIDNGDDIRKYPKFHKCRHLFIEGSLSQNPFHLFFNLTAKSLKTAQTAKNRLQCKFPYLQILELENIVINPISAMAPEISQIYEEIIVDVFQGIDIQNIIQHTSSQTNSGSNNNSTNNNAISIVTQTQSNNNNNATQTANNDFSFKNDLYCKLMYDRACVICLHRCINCILKNAEKANVNLLVFKYHNSQALMQKAMRNVVVIERKLYDIVNHTKSRNFNNEWDHVAQNAFNEYDEIVIPSTVEFLSLSHVFCNVDIRKCKKLIACNFECIAYKQVKFSSMKNNKNYIIPYLKCVMKHCPNYMQEWKNVTSWHPDTADYLVASDDNLSDYDFDFGVDPEPLNENKNSLNSGEDGSKDLDEENCVELPIPVRFVYLEDENGCVSNKECEAASHHIGSSYDLDEWIERITNNDISDEHFESDRALRLKRCVYLTRRIPNMVEKLINMVPAMDIIKEHKLRFYRSWWKTGYAKWMDNI